MFVGWDIQVLAASIEKNDCDALIYFGKLFGDVSHVQKSQGAFFSLVVGNDKARISIVYTTMSL